MPLNTECAAPADRFVNYRIRLTKTRDRLANLADRCKQAITLHESRRPCVQLLASKKEYEIDKRILLDHSETFFSHCRRLLELLIEFTEARLSILRRTRGSPRDLLALDDAEKLADAAEKAMVEAAKDAEVVTRMQETIVGSIMSSNLVRD